MKAEEIENIFTELIAVYENLKAEIIVAEFQDNSDLTIDDIVVSNKSTFSRPYRRDIIDVDNLINDNKITLNLSRNGLYDTLPEGLFHIPKGNQDSNSYLSRRKIYRQEEKDAREFFAPIENEFFYQRLSIEKNERQLLDDFYKLNDEFLLEFWNMDEDIPEDFKLKLIKLLPYSYKISGNFELTRLSLERLLGEPVSFKRTYGTYFQPDKKTQKKKRKEELTLGVDSILVTDEKEIASPELEVTIGPISENKVNKFLKKNGIKKFINTFYDYFVPIELDVSTKFTIKNDKGFLLDGTNSAIMGISTQI